MRKALWIIIIGCVVLLVLAWIVKASSAKQQSEKEQQAQYEIEKFNVGTVRSIMSEV